MGAKGVTQFSSNVSQTCHWTVFGAGCTVALTSKTAGQGHFG